LNAEPLKQSQMALQGIRILDFTDSVVGPFCGLLLAGCGAEVIKIESRNHLGFRRMGPWGPPGMGPIPNLPEKFIDFANLDINLLVPPNFSELNHDKLSISLNLTKEEGRDLFKRLIRISDVVLENFSFGVMQKWGFDYEGLKNEKENIIYASIPSFGRGPKQAWSTWGMNLLSYSGFSYMWGHPQTNMADRMASGFHGDYMAGTMSASVIVAALYHRALTGKGQFVEIPQAQTTTNILGPAYLDYFVNKRIDPPRGDRHPQFAPYNCYRCRGEDEWCVVAVFSEEDWQHLCRAMDEPSWSTDPKFQDMEGRLNNADELDRNIESWTAHRTKRQVMRLLQYYGVSAGAVQNQEDLYYDLQLRKRGSIFEQDFPRLGAIEMASLPVHLSEGQRTPSRHTSALGEHNDYVFGKLLGLTGAQMKNLQDLNVIF
jgi:crotonobetainyl-CoA:carnitine CoA-transferase CaiB-like acyl-CoA transferase